MLEFMKHMLLKEIIGKKKCKAQGFLISNRIHYDVQTVLREGAIVMNKIKKGLTFILVVALCASLLSVASAKTNKQDKKKDGQESQTLSADVQTLKTLGLLIGSGKDGLTYEYSRSKPTRAQAFVIYLRLIDDAPELEKFSYHDGDDNFDDHHGKSDYIKKVMAYAKAHPEYNWVGSNGRFNPIAHVTAKQYAKIMLTALNYKYGVDFLWENVESFAEGIGLNIPVGDFTFEKLATMTVQTLYTVKKDTSQNLIDYLASVNPEFAEKVALLENDAPADTTKPVVTDVVLSAPYVAGPPAVSGKVTVYFSEAMKTETLTNLANYYADLDGAAAAYSSTQLSLMAGASAVPSADKKSVTLTIPGSALSGGNSAGAGVTNMTVSGLKDASGNTIEPVTQYVRQASALTVLSSAAVDLNKLQVTFNNPIATIDSTEFKLYREDGTTLASVGTSAALDAAGKIVTVTLGGSLTASAKANPADMTRAKLAIGTEVTRDVFGNAVSGAVAVPVVSAANPATVTILDKIAPSVLSVETQDLDKDGYLDAVKVIFSESIKDSSVNAGNFNVAGYSSESFAPAMAGDAANDNIIYIAFSEASAPDTGMTPEISYTQGTLEDTAGNKMASTGAVATIDKAAPAVTGALPAGVLTAGSVASSAVLVLSEDITAFSRQAVLAAVQAHTTDIDLVTIGDISRSFVWTTNKMLTVAITGNANGSVNPDSIVLTAAAADLTDASGNTEIAAQIIK